MGRLIKKERPLPSHALCSLAKAEGALLRRHPWAAPNPPSLKASNFNPGSRKTLLKAIQFLLFLSRTRNCTPELSVGERA